MSNVVVDKQKIDILANAIADKSGVPVTMTLDEMKEAVDGIDAGGIVPTGNINITHSGQTDVTNYAMATVPTGTEGTPTATKVIDSVEVAALVTPSVTNNAGYISGGTHTGNGVWVTSRELVSGLSITADDSGEWDVANVETMVIPAGTAGTPTATKGTVSNHAVTVTPSVTNSAGYITGGTKNGTAVSVSASELVSGTLEINSSGTKDVTNYASAYVPQMTLPTAPSSSHTGTVRSSISWASSIRYLNVPAGYNDTARYYTLEGVPLDPITITENGTYNALDYEAAGFSTVVVNVQGGTSGVQVAGTSATRTSASSISFSELRGEPIAFYAMIDGNDIGTSATATIVAFVYDGQTLHAQTVNNQITYDGSSLSYTYNNGTLTITSNGATIPDANFVLSYAYGGTSANIDTKNVQVGSGATSITFSGLADEPVAWACIFKSNFSTSSGYQRVAYVDYEDGDIFGVSMDSSAHCATDWTASYSNGSLTISSTSASVGGYFHQPGYYQLTAIYGEPVETTIEPLTVTENGTYSESGVAYSPVVVNVPTGGGVNVATTTWTNSSSTATSHTFTGLLGTPKAAFLRCTSSLSRSSNSSNYFVADMRWTGTATAGNSFRRSNGTYANVTSGYSFTASGTSLTVTTSGTSTSNPGSFYNGGYELTYVY